MKIEKNLDEILDILYDENLLHWKEIPTTDIIAFGKRKYNITWSDQEISFIMKMLQTDGYVVMNQGDLNRGIMPTFSLTTKGIQLKRKGGFVRVKLIEDFKQNIIFWGSIIALIVSIMTIYDFIKKHCFSTRQEKCCISKDCNKRDFDSCVYEQGEKSMNNCCNTDPAIRIENNPVFINNIGKTDTTIIKKVYLPTHKPKKKKPCE